MRRAMGHARCTLSCLRGAEAYSARRLRSGGREAERLSDPSTVIPSDARPRPPRGLPLLHNEPQCCWLLLSPHRAFKADALYAEIIKPRTGADTFPALIHDLPKADHAP